MSGSSLDGLDLCFVRFKEENGNYGFQIMETTTLPYPDSWKLKLSEAFHKQAAELEQLDKEYGRFLGQQVREFSRQHHARPDFVASHGHTVFHQPERHYTLQIGDGQELADECGFLTINDFRSEDVSKGGQGAPLVPIGDKLLFSDYEICLNIGGIANLSFDEAGKRIACDICIANQALNHLAQRKGHDFDKDGVLAQSGSIDLTLLKQLNNHPFFVQMPPKSLGREFFETYQKGLLDSCSIPDALATFVEHIAIQIALSVNHLQKGKLLVTGGGAKNKYLMERIQARVKHEIVMPTESIIDYKEALVFAFLGLLRLERKTNVLSSVTGATSDSSSGKVWSPRPPKAP